MASKHSRPDTETAPRRYAAGVEYDGSAFSGWQRQDGERTVQGALEAALGQVADQPVELVCAGRTDAGVHALAQVVHFDSAAERSPRSWLLGTNSNLVPDVALRWVLPVSAEFHARFRAQRRDYRYLILSRPTRPALGRQRYCWTHRTLDVRRMARAARYLLGEHDFSSYRAIACQARNPVRTVYRLEVRRAGELIAVEISANGFLHHMVRNIAGVLMAIGRGDHPPRWARAVLEHRDRTLGGVTAPAQGLYLTGVHYPAEFGLPPPAGALWPRGGFW